ncbi:SMI1/KNR4 family protein [Bacillus sp. DX4.1]|uniref:SMI1/KNR4 family protein n=1 Tax=Bacillus sp. DX4.1 TaxID=3055867 RepID=UPI0025A20010|nr:SMI1/KNR4 family protein [Bacillus sp. DX4.1]MDM5187364.1 SMI1/KNR4 family protein [Bacillus sp. DX4.1]
MIDLSNIPGFIKNKPGNDIEIQELEDLMKIKFPHVYKDLLTYTNGFSINGGVTIYGTDEIVERNKTLEVNEYANGYVAIGDDGSGNVFLMLQSTDSKEVLLVDSGDMNPNHATIITLDFSEWINFGCFNITTNRIPDICNIVLVETPNGGLKDLVKIKSVLGTDMPAADLLKGSKNLPFTVVKNFPYGKAKKLIQKLKPFGVVLNLIPIDEH